MSCGLKWKTCECPWFTYQAVENDRLLHMNVGGNPAGFRGFPGYFPLGHPNGHPNPLLRHPVERRERPNVRPDGRPNHLPRPPEERREQGRHEHGRHEHDRHEQGRHEQGRHEQGRHEQGRHEQDGWDEFFARRLQMQMWGLDIADDNNDFARRLTERYSPFHNEDYAHRAPDMISGAAMHAMAAAGNRPNGRPRNNINPPPPTPRQVLVDEFSRILEEPPDRLRRIINQEEPPLRHRHSAASRQYNNKASTRPSERVVPRRAVADYELEAQTHQPDVVAPAAPSVVGAAGESGGEAPGAVRPGRRHSAMAGLTRGSGEGRVDEWRRHIGEE